MSIKGLNKCKLIKQYKAINKKMLFTWLKDSPFHMNLSFRSQNDPMTGIHSIKLPFLHLYAATRVLLV